MTKAAELAKMGEVLTNSQIGGRRNLIINGAMQVAQRSTSSTGVTSNGYHACDRMNLEISSLGTHTVTQETLTSGAAYLAGFTKAFRVDCTTADASPAAGDYMVFQQKIEAQNLQQLAFGTSDAKSLTLSFYVKSNKTGTYEIMHFVSDGTRQVNSTYTINSANTWEKKILSIPADTGGTINNDNGEGWRSLFYLGRGSDRAGGSTPTSWQAYAIANEAPSQTVNIADNTANDWAITGYQLEVGSQATPFEHRSFGEELALCQRYFFKSGKGESQYAAFAQGWATASTAGTAHVAFPVEMRAEPSFSHSNLQVSDDANAGIAITSSDTNSAVSQRMYGYLEWNVSSGATTYRSYAIRGNNNTSAFIAFEAEL
tara:strand:+ start:208 stop:1323 length:1116 start_codon:yes stop_codon:yes gene_type:complete